MVDPMLMQQHRMCCICGSDYGTGWVDSNGMAWDLCSDECAHQAGADK